MTVTDLPRQHGGGGARAGAARRVPPLQRPLASYHLLLGATLLLVSLGLVMVFSASSVRAYDTFGSSFSIALKQGIFVAVSLPVMFVASRMPVRFWRMAGYPALIVAVLLLVVVLIPTVGKGVDGSTRWIPLPGGFNIQPSELAKLALALWGADLLVRKDKLLGDPKHLFIPLLPVSGFVVLLIMLEPDLGTTLATTAVVLALLWTVGTPFRWFLPFLGVLVAGAGYLAVSAPYRLARLASFIDPCSPEHRLDGGYQACQGLQALSSGGPFGLGLGASREKWAGGLPNAHTDYVFAIIGEELGLLGTLSVLILFSALTYSGVRIAQRATDPFVRLVSASLTAWLAAQAVINLGAVVGLLPITGIPLPLVSFGGSAMIATMLAIGILLSFARVEPGAAEALAERRGLWLTRLSVLPGASGSRSGPRRDAGRKAAATPRAATPRAATPRAATPRPASPRAATPRVPRPRPAGSRTSEPRDARPAGDGSAGRGPHGRPRRR